MNVWIPKGRSVYYAKFNHKLKSYFRSLKTANKKLAMQRARVLREAVVSDDYESLERMRHRCDYSKIGEVVKAYLSYPALQCSKRTARANASSLLSIVRRAFSGRRPEEVSSWALDADMVYSYHESILADCPADNPVARQSAENTGASNLRRARSMFRDQVRDRAYKKLKLPDLSGFRKGMPFKVRVARSEDIGEDMRSHLFEATERELRDTGSPLYMIWCLAAYCGMRPKEIVAARWDWIKEDGAQAYIELRPREDSDTKGHDCRRVSLYSCLGHRLKLSTW